MKKDRRYTIAIVFDSSREPISFSVHRLVIVAGFVLVALVTTGVILLADVDVGTTRLADQQSTLADTQANLDAMVSEIEHVDALGSEFDAALEPIINALTVNSEHPGSADRLSDSEMDAFFGAEQPADAREAEIQELRHLAAELDRSGELLRDTRSTQQLVSSLLVDIPNAWPVGGNGGDVSMEYGPNIHPITHQWYLHKGFDIAGYPGTPIVASANGTVVLAGYDPGYGFQVILRHKYGYLTRYPHMREILVTEGQELEQGEILGTMGSTGIVTGTHLHFEVMLGNDVLDPAPFLKISNTFRRGGYGTR